MGCTWRVSDRLNAHATFCQHEDRDMLEQNIIDGIAEPRILDKDMGWRANTAERHMKNHAGEYHRGANHSCVVCTSDDRSALEVAYFEGDRTSEDIAAELDLSEELVYRHMKHHFQPLVSSVVQLHCFCQSRARSRYFKRKCESLNGKLAQFMCQKLVYMMMG